jgi:SOS response regulatory protein OraA/RecX
LKLLNDLEYAKNFVFIAKKKHYGSIKIIEELKLSKVCEEDIFNALEDYSLSEEIENCNITFDKYLTSLKKCSSALAKKKMVNHLISKGFSNDSITNVVEKKQKMLDNISDEDKLLAVAFEKLKKAKKTNDEREFKQKAIRSLTAKGFPLSKVLKIVEGRK